MNLHYLSSALSALSPNMKNHLWQSTFFAAGCALMTLGMRKNLARARYWVWFAASIKFLLPFSMLMSIGAAVMPHRHTAPVVRAVYDFIDIVGQPFSTTFPSVTTASKAVPAPGLEWSWSLSLSSVLAATWTLGALSIMTTWGIYWWRIRTIVQQSTEATDGPEILALRELHVEGWGPAAEVNLRLSEANFGPGVYGISRPTLIWPSRISERLNDAQLRSILTHELCHIKFRDNLTACLHMVVEAVFWFHPLVWWLGSQLELERERACDEHVLQLTKAPLTYAESILQVCEICLESPLECVSGVTGADLKERIKRIMTNRMGERLTPLRKAMLTAAVLGTFAVPIICGQVANSPGAPAQGGSSRPDQSFEVATIKPVENSAKTSRFIKLEGTKRVVIRDYNLRLLIAAAYNMNPKTISGGPEWVDSDYFDISALAPGSGQTSPTREAQMSMLRNLLEDRFKLTYHREQKEFSIFALEVAKDGPKLKATSLSPTDPSSVGPGMVYPQKIVMPARNATMNDFTSLLQRAVLDRPVVDMTGLTGRYDFTLEWAPDENQFGGELHPASEDAPSPPLFQAVQQQLGLRLYARKGPVSAMVIDQVEHPAPN
ncbi:antirepressor regulating drug resistance protein [Terriglobus roseus DSM 18391]|uniref:Antirepressor regulating drug resistance protein n=1 Tax=Terriglobus roseus (strain DSM 18391 / NRRL B-41598 / KBS 63) TaxID=926566 RepID=I3ZJ35_TERRK|nr:M56 family metallopeptidase [Terriglobus roseus]AFL89253.1 antirepressor regulating drug resistance protein [Terriglobus roseus DSM 18391]